MAHYPVLFILDDTNGWLPDTSELYRNKQWSQGIKEEESKRKNADSVKSTNSSGSSTNSPRSSLIRIVADNVFELAVIKETFKLHEDVKSIKADTGKLDKLSSAKQVMNVLNAAGVDFNPNTFCSITYSEGRIVGAKAMYSQSARRG